MMASLDKRNGRALAKVFNKISKAVKRTVDNKELQRNIGNFLVTDIRRSAERGFIINPSDTGKLKRNPALAKSTKKKRKEIAAYNKTAATFSPNKSNLTFSGQYLQSIVAVVKRGFIIVSARGSRKPYRNKDGSSVKNTPSNEELTKFLGGGSRILTSSGFKGAGARNIFGVTRNRLKFINGLFRRSLRSALKNLR
jgi:hypothetical protein